MKTAGDILSTLFDERFIKKAQGYSKLFESWKDMTEKNGIAAAADHCRIKDLDNGILFIEADHPGWKQILQAKQAKLLNDFRIRFPDQDICGISFILGKSDSFIKKDGNEQTKPAANNKKTEPEIKSQNAATNNVITAVGIDAIKDEDFKESLIKLGQTIAEVTDTLSEK